MLKYSVCGVLEKLFVKFVSLFLSCVCVCEWLLSRCELLLLEL